MCLSTHKQMTQSPDSTEHINCQTNHLHSANTMTKLMELENEKPTEMLDG